MKAKIIITVLTALFLTSCVNTNIPEHLKNNTKKDKPVTPPKDSELGKSVLVKNALLNLQRKYGRNCNKIGRRFIFDLDTGKFLTLDKLFSSEWEFGFGHMKYITVNNSNGVPYRVCTDGKLGEEQSLKGNVLCTLVAKTFDEVTEAPDPATYLYNVVRYVSGKVAYKDGTTDTTIPRFSYYHNMYGVSEDDVISYSLYEGGSKDEFDRPITEAIPNRTFIFKTSEGNYAKLQFLCLLKDCPKDEEIKEGQKVAITFRYFVQKDGSRNLNHKE